VAKAPQGLAVGRLLDALGEELACRGNVLFSVVPTTKLGNLSTMVCDQRAIFGVVMRQARHQKWNYPYAQDPHGNHGINNSDLASICA